MRSFSVIHSFVLSFCKQDRLTDERGNGRRPNLAGKGGATVLKVGGQPLAKNSIVNYRKNTIVLSLKYTIVKLL